MSLYLSKSSCISFQDHSAENLELVSLANMESNELKQPNYKDLLKPALLRRMSKVLKMGNYAAKSVLVDAEGEIHQPDAIIVGTGLGCIKDTIGFIDEVLKNDEQTLAPTAFIQSTHNSIAGQIALMLKNYNYNMTLVQQGLSFEMALLDAEQQLATTSAESVLVGAADEMTEKLEALLGELANKIGMSMPRLGEGAAFFLATAEPSSDTVARLKDVYSLGQAASNRELLDEYGINIEDYDLILNGGQPLAQSAVPELAYKDYCGEYFTAPAFATNLALDIFKGRLSIQESSTPQKILILNTFGNQYGAIALEKFEV